MSCINVHYVHIQCDLILARVNSADRQLILSYCNALSKRYINYYLIADMNLYVKSASSKKYPEIGLCLLRCCPLTV